MKAVPGILPTLLEMIYFFSTPTIDVEPQFKRGDKITQLVVLPVAYPDVVQVEEITGGPRGDDGYGSTG